LEAFSARGDRLNLEVVVLGSEAFDSAGAVALVALVLAILMPLSLMN
jgi:hypothetical protein